MKQIQEHQDVDFLLECFASLPFTAIAISSLYFKDDVSNPQFLRHHFSNIGHVPNYALGVGILALILQYIVPKSCKSHVLETFSLRNRLAGVTALGFAWEFMDARLPNRSFD